MSPVSSRRCLAQQNRDVVQHIDHLDATGQRNEPRTTNLVQRVQNSQLWPHTRLHGGYLHTYSLQSIQRRRGGRRIESIPLRPCQVGSIPCGNLLDALLDAWLCCGEFTLGDYIFDIATAVSAAVVAAHDMSTHSLCICPHMSPSVTPDSFRIVVHHGERSVMICITDTRGSVAG